MADRRHIISNVLTALYQPFWYAVLSSVLLGFIYDGIMMNENCVITMPGDVIDEDLEISEPVLLEENKELPLPDQIIQGVVFRPYRSALLPCKIAFSEKTKKDIIRIPACCEYRIIEEESAICLQ